ncbi:MAG: hypothetical protein HY723_03675 [Chloroflexi bacterium]|nr:hypothetical protein [Chloroflexota bacterium]
MVRWPVNLGSELPIVAVGIARLPRTVVGDGGQPLMIELTVEPPAGLISAVAATVSLPGYTALLQGLLVGTHIDQAEAAVHRIALRLRGPLLRPTLAAVANALANMRSEAAAVAAGGGG